MATKPAIDTGPSETHQHGETEISLRYGATDTGRIVVIGKGARRIPKLERMRRHDIIEERHLKAAEKFAHHFHNAKLERYATVNMFRVMGGKPNPEGPLYHRGRIRAALEALGGLQGSIVWHVVGLDKSLASWCDARPVPFRRDYGVGLLVGALDKLSEIYGT